ncbi:MAG: Flp pilus assembly complex ATPase component TadA [Clostridia bacterium]|nr:Flp pilus assembly complex ATPase component TadA [Clostridia bacterium]
MAWREQISRRLPGKAAEAVLELNDTLAQQVSELRIRLNCRALAIAGESCVELPYSPDAEGMETLMAALSGYSLYACEREMASGYIALPGGHRAGICGRLGGEDGSLRMSSVTSVCIRIARHIPGASLPIRSCLMDEAGRPRSVLILGPPGCGKTTMLRDAALYLARERRLQVAAADERGELFAGLMHLSPPVDVMTGMDKAALISMLLRAMAPDVIVCDEIGGEEEAEAIEDAARCGAALLASAHAEGMDAMTMRPSLLRLHQAGVFAVTVCLNRSGIRIYERTGE